MYSLLKQHRIMSHVYFDEQEIEIKTITWTEDVIHFNIYFMEHRTRLWSLSTFLSCCFECINSFSANILYGQSLFQDLSMFPCNHISMY